MLKQVFKSGLYNRKDRVAEVVGIPKIVEWVNMALYAGDDPEGWYEKHVVGRPQWYLEVEFDRPIDTSKVYTVKIYYDRICNEIPVSSQGVKQPVDYVVKAFSNNGDGGGEDGALYCLSGKVSLIKNPSFGGNNYILNGKSPRLERELIGRKKRLHGT